MAKILLLDDSTTILKVVRLTFASQPSFQILWARTSGEAEKMIAADCPDVIIGYVHFAAEKSVDFFKRIRTLQSKILFLNENTEDILPLQKAGFEYFLKKPFVSEELKNKVESLLQIFSTPQKKQPQNINSIGIAHNDSLENKDLSITQMVPTILAVPVLPQLEFDKPDTPRMPPPTPPTLNWKETIKEDEPPEMSFDLENIEKKYRETLGEQTLPKNNKIELMEETSEPFVLEDVKVNTVLTSAQETTPPKTEEPNLDFSNLENTISSRIEVGLLRNIQIEVLNAKQKVFQELKDSLKEEIIAEIRRVAPVLLKEIVQENLSKEVRSTVEVWTKSEGANICRDEIQKTIQKVLDS
jgi:CheY-like chemotaxis protein